MRLHNILAKDFKILVFSSNIDAPEKVKLAKNELLKTEGIYRANIDLDDNENVLRVECHPDCSPNIIEEQVARLGFKSSEFRNY